MRTWLMIFRDTLLSILVFMNENYCLCTCFTELYLFHLLFVRSRNFYRYASCFQLYINIACKSIQNAARKYYSPLKITHYKTINSFISKREIKPNSLTNSLSCWSVNCNSINVHSNTWQLALQICPKREPFRLAEKGILGIFLSFSLKAHNHLIPCISHRTRFFMRDDVVSQHLKSGAHSFRILGSKKLPCFSNFPASLARPKKIVWFLLPTTSNHVQVKLDCTTRINILHQQRRKKWAYWFLDLQSKSRTSRIYYLWSRSSLGRFAA